MSRVPVIALVLSSPIIDSLADAGASDVSRCSLRSAPNTPTWLAAAASASLLRNDAFRGRPCRSRFRETAPTTRCELAKTAEKERPSLSTPRGFRGRPAETAAPLQSAALRE